MRRFYLSKKTNIKANKTNAQRIPPSPSNMVDIMAANLESSRNNLHKKEYNHSNDKNFGIAEVIAD